MSELNSVLKAIKLVERQYVEASTAYNVYLRECNFFNKLPSMSKLNDLSNRISYLLEQRSELEDLRASLSNNLVLV